MKLNFTKSKISIGKERIFFPETTPCDEHPSFSMVNCEQKCPEDYKIDFCLVKIAYEMKTNKESFISALTKLMKDNKVVKLTNVLVELSSYSKNRYIPDRVRMILSVKLVNDMNDVELNISNIRSDISNKCGSIEYAHQSLTDKSVTLTQFLFTENTDVYVLRDMENCLWNVRCRLLDDWQQMHTYIKHGLPIPPQENENKIFIVLQPREEFEMFANGMCEGVSDISVIDFGYDYKTSDHIYGALLANEIAIIRVDTLPHPVAKESTVNIYTCVPVKLIPTILTVGVPDKKVYEACQQPIEDMLIQHMGEYKRISNVDVSWGFETTVDDLIIKPPVTNPFSPVELRIVLGEKYGGILNYSLTFSSNNIDVDNTLERNCVTKITNSGCKF